VTHLKVLIISDTHGRIEAAKTAILKERPDVVIHLGDHAKDAEELRGFTKGALLYSVKGNCDPYSLANEELLLEFAGHRIIAAHGHKQKVKQDKYGIYFAALDNGVDIALFGHTHIPYIGEKDEIMLLNPGTAGSGHHLTAARLILTSETKYAEIIEI